MLISGRYYWSDDVIRQNVFMVVLLESMCFLRQHFGFKKKKKKHSTMNSLKRVNAEKSKILKVVNVIIFNHSLILTEIISTHADELVWLNHSPVRNARWSMCSMSNCEYNSRQNLFFFFFYLTTVNVGRKRKIKRKWFVFPGPVDQLQVYISVSWFILLRQQLLQIYIGPDPHPNDTQMFPVNNEWSLFLLSSGV